MSVDESFVKQEIEPMSEFNEEDKQYQTEGDEEVGNFESGSQENGKIASQSSKETEPKTQLFKIIFKMKI